MLAIEGDHIMSLIVGFLKRYGEEELADLVSDKIINPEDLKSVPLAKKKLEKIIQNYVLQDKKLVAYYESKNQEESQEEEVKIKPQKKKRKRSASHSREMREQLNDKSQSQEKEVEKKTGIYSKFTKPKLLETTVEKVSVKQEKTHKKQKKTKKQQKIKAKPKKAPTSQSEEESQEEIKPKAKQSKPIIKEKSTRKISKQVKQVQDEEESEKQKQITKTKQVQKVKTFNHNTNKNNYDNYNEEDNNGYQTKQKKFFSRIDPSKIAPLPQNLRDNTYEAKLKYGDGGDDWGKYGNQKLKNQRGEGFKKMKGKLKNKAFQGGTIDPFRVNSISLL